MNREIAGIVLCGGHSRRMKQPKWSLPIGGELMLQRVVRLVDETLTGMHPKGQHAITVVAGPHFEEISALNFPSPSMFVCKDLVADFGPVAGIAGGLSALENHGAFEAAFVTGCDYPFLKPGFVTELVHQLGDEQILIPTDGTHDYPLSGLYRTSVLKSLKSMIDDDDHRLLNLLERANTHRIETSHFQAVDPNLTSLQNINTPEDYERALSMMLADQSD